MRNKKEILIAVTGASGVIYAKFLIEYLVNCSFDVNLILSKNSIDVINIELGTDIQKDDIQIKKFLNCNTKKIKLYREDNFLSPYASGSHRFDAMVIVPCSMGTLSAIANGFAHNLITRAADICLKEKIKLIVVPRETPFSSIHLENMLKLSRCGAIILPAVPGFYNKPREVSDLVKFVVSRILDHLEIENDLVKRWGV
jgi:4-hydroxy-3-polyprenylbenzoate decarboxylase